MFTYWYGEERDEELREKTDKSRWRLAVDRGRQVWKYVEEGSDAVQSVYDRYFLGLDISQECPDFDEEPSTPIQAASNAVSFFSKLQAPDGHWAADYGGPHFLLGGVVIATYVSGKELPREHQREIVVYLSNTQSREDGGWGLHVESLNSTPFGTTLNYVVMRLLGVPADDERCVRARAFIHKHGGALGVPQWCKFWLCALGVFEWEGMNPVQPELWMMPYWIPLHPGRWWCHTRIIYLPMGYIYATRSTGAITPLVKALRGEIFTQPYDSIPWAKHRNDCNPLDLYHPHSWFHDALFTLCTWYERFHSKWLRRKAVAKCLDHVLYEDKHTNHICLGPVNKAINMLVTYHALGPDSPDLQAHYERVFDYLWLSADGMKMQGYNGSQLWDCAFSVQAIYETGLLEQAKDCLTLAHSYIDVTQVRVSPPDYERYYRHTSHGAWPFSTSAHGWPISDCTSEGLKAALLLHNECEWITPFADAKERLCDAVNVLFSYQNPEGGWASYERQRSPPWMEMINPAECFNDIMVEYMYVECGSACVQGLMAFHKRYPEHRAEELLERVAKGVTWIKREQMDNGGWLGKWGVCFTYATWFAVWAIVAAGEDPKTSPHVLKACAFLLGKQREDGSWGESFQSCVQYKWIDTEEGQVVNTAWALLTLMKAECPDVAAIERGIVFLMRRQERNGDWKQEPIKGVFNANCSISYSLYKNYFPIWALGMYANKYKQSTLNTVGRPL